MTVVARCLFCSVPVEPNSTRVYRRVRGWEHPRRDGGTNALALREPLDEFACSTCIDRQRAGVAPTQGALV